MSQQKLLEDVIRVLKSSGCEYMLTGSYASSLQGEPRLSHDIDIVVGIFPGIVDTFINAFRPPEFFIDIGV